MEHKNNPVETVLWKHLLFLLLISLSPFSSSCLSSSLLFLTTQHSAVGLESNGGENGREGEREMEAEIKRGREGERERDGEECTERKGEGERQTNG